MHQRSALDPQGHSQLLLGMIEEVLSEAGVLRDDLDAIVYDAGPGSFTGIRIGAGVAQGIALALEKPLFAISSLMTLAEAMVGEVGPNDRILAAIDARMEQVYWGCLERDEAAPGGWRWHEPPRVSDPDTVSGFAIGCFVGNSYRQTLTRPGRLGRMAQRRAGLYSQRCNGLGRFEVGALTAGRA